MCLCLDLTFSFGFWFLSPFLPFSAFPFHLNQLSFPRRAQQRRRSLFFFLLFSRPASRDVNRVPAASHPGSACPSVHHFKSKTFIDNRLFLGPFYTKRPRRCHLASFEHDTPNKRIPFLNTTILIPLQTSSSYCFVHLVIITYTTADNVS